MSGASDLQTVFDGLKPLLATYVPPLTATRDESARYDTCSVRPLVLFGRKRDGVDFASIAVQKAFVGFYFMPVYGEPALIGRLHPDLQKRLKGKACFHIKDVDEATLAQITDALRLGFDKYRERDWI